MNDHSESTRDGQSSGDHMNGRPVDNELTDHSLNTLPDEMFQRSTRERADRFQIWHLLSSGQELGMESGRNNRFMAVFSHELRNSLDAIRGAAGILRMDTSADPLRGEGPKANRTSGWADDASRRRPSRRVTRPKRTATPEVRASRSAGPRSSCRADRRIHHATAPSQDDHIISGCAGVATGGSRPTRAGVREPALERGEVHR